MARQENESFVWFEVWHHDYEPPYLLLVVGLAGGHVKILDPVEKNRLAFVAANYEEAHLWLLEDGFEMVRGRTLSDDLQNGEMTAP